jgi:hypothetical protein
MSEPPPKVFVSHASEDKDRFVIRFAERLRADGVDAWLDRWEIEPGDSLVNRIFEEGIRTADVFVIVLSEHSVEKPWDREELSAAVVHRIEGACRLIPIVLDGVRVPVVLKSTVWQPIADPSSYDDEYRRIVDAIHGASSRPPLGDPPAYRTTTVLIGLNPADSSVLATLCEHAISGARMFVSGESLTASLEGLGLSPNAVVESLLGLERAGMLEDARIMRGDRVMYVKVGWRGLLRYLADSQPDLGSHRQSLVAHLINDEATSWDIVDLAHREGLPRLVVEALLVPYESENLLQITRFMGNHTEVRNISPLLRRELEWPGRPEIGRPHSPRFGPATVDEARSALVRF